MFSFSSRWSFLQIFLSWIPITPGYPPPSTNQLDYKKINKPNKTTFARHLSRCPDLHHFLSAAQSCSVSLLLSPLPALWKANEESWAEGSFCVLVKKNNLCQRKVLQQLCCRTCSLKGWRNFSSPTCRSRSANLYSSREPQIWDYIVRFPDARTTTNLPFISVCLYACMNASVSTEAVRVVRLGSVINSKSYMSVFCDQSMDAKFLYLFLHFGSKRRIWSDMLSVEVAVLYFSTASRMMTTTMIKASLCIFWKKHTQRTSTSFSKTSVSKGTRKP